MLKYSIKIGNENIERDEMVWTEKYVAPDLSFVSGVTSQDYHLEKNTRLAASIGDDTNFTSLFVSSENVTRNGYVKIEEKEYEIKTGTTSEISARTFSYVDINGVYYYITGNTITVKNWLKELWIGNKVDIIEGDASGTVVGNVVKLNTIVWIEDDTVTIDGNKYIFDKYDKSENSPSPGGIKYYETGRCLAPTEITKCSTMSYHYFENVSEYKPVTKFILTKDDNMPIDFDKITFCSYFYYVSYKNYYCPVALSRDTGDTGNTGDTQYQYVCQIPKRLFEDVDLYTKPYYETEDIPLMYNYMDGETYTSGNVTTDVVSNLNKLKDIEPFIEFNNSIFQVEQTLQNANYGNELAIYVSNETLNLNVNDVISLVITPDEGNIVPVLEDGENGELFVLYGNEKRLVEDILADVVEINNIYYDISYPSGKTDGMDAIVNIDGNDVYMNIISGSTKLQRYGFIVRESDSVATVAEYDIITYSGVTINDTVYRVMEEVNSTDTFYYIVFDRPISYDFEINWIEGSSLLICQPKLDTNEFTSDFIDNITDQLCRFFVANQKSTRVYIKNNAFGIREITPEIGFVRVDDPLSSKDYYDALENLKIYSDTGRIQIKLPMTFKMANNIMQTDIVERDFYEVEIEKAINPIIDMEKDVYYPMFLNGKYQGSKTVFNPVNEIRVNMHFRTRNMDNWKVNEGYNDVETSGISNNWFCTDFFPYSGIVATNSGATALMNSSDLMGLLEFSDADVFYQKDNVAKSFLRFSYYDSTDSNTQNLLATSTVFMDEHILYKKYIDNIRRNIYDYGFFHEPTEGNSGNTINKISVSGECIGVHENDRREYDADDVIVSALTTDERRISSRFTIKNKYATDTSSEGFYLYMFKEYSENLHPKPIYMKIEFNHAGVGRIIPLIVPMRWTGSTDNIFNPTSALTLIGNDLDYLKQGYPLSYVEAQSYIPLYAVYDFKDKRYGYVFDSRYVSIDEENRAVLNLFEMKIMDESSRTVSDNELEAVTNNNIARARINVNTEQFGEI